MKAANTFSAITLTAVAILTINLPQNAYAVGTSTSIPAASQPAAQHISQHENRNVRKVELAIDADRDKIIEESNVIKLDRRKLKDADKMSEKVNAEEIRKDIETREAKIKDLKKEIASKKEQRYLLMNGKQKDEPRRTRRDAK